MGDNNLCLQKQVMGIGRGNNTCLHAFSLCLGNKMKQAKKLLVLFLFHILVFPFNQHKIYVLFEYPRM